MNRTKGLKHMRGATAAKVLFLPALLLAAAWGIQMRLDTLFEWTLLFLPINAATSIVGFLFLATPLLRESWSGPPARILYWPVLFLLAHLAFLLCWASLPAAVLTSGTGVRADLQWLNPMALVLLFVSQVAAGILFGREPEAEPDSPG